MSKTTKPTTIPLREISLSIYQDRKAARFAIKLALEEFEKDNDVEALLDTLRLVAKAQGGLAKLARKASVSRQALHEALSPRGNPRLRTFQNVLGSLGLRMTVKPATKKSGRALAMAKLF